MCQKRNKGKRTIRLLLLPLLLKLESSSRVRFCVSVRWRFWRFGGAGGFESVGGRAFWLTTWKGFLAGRAGSLAFTPFDLPDRI